MAAEELRILFRDPDIICCVKEPGIISEGSGMPALISLVTGETEVYPVHRLDRETGGVMVFALNRRSAAALSEEFSPSGSAEKTYLAVLEGVPEEKNGILTDLLFYDRTSRRSYVVDRMRKGVREASLSYSVLSSAEDMSLVSVKLHSGRTHQIRVQFSHAGHPVLGDRRYGSKAKCGLALWSASLSFRHPSDGQRQVLSCPPPGAHPWNTFTEKIQAFPEELR